MCEMIDEIEMEHLRIALSRAKKDLQKDSISEEPLAAVAQ